MLREALPEIVTGSVPGTKAKAILDRRNEAVPKGLCGSTYPICMEKGEGAMLEDVDSNKFLDWIGGVGVLNIGYSRLEVVEAVKAQAEKYFHGIFNVYVHEGYVKLAEMFNETVPCKGGKMKTYFANSGAEADENAIKIAKAYTGRDNIICFSRSSAANIPVNMELCEKMGLDKDNYSVSIPLSSMINMDGAAITVMTLAAAHTLEISVNIPTAIVLSILATLSACGASEIAGGTLLLIPVACSLFGISNDIAMQVVGVGFIIGVIQDSCETALNSSSDVLLTATAEFMQTQTVTILSCTALKQEIYDQQHP